MANTQGFVDRSELLNDVANIFRTYDSPPFKLLVDEHTFYVHSDLLARTSRSFSRMIEGPSKEHAEGAATIDGISAGSFERFIDWIYHGDYNAPLPEIEPHESNVRKLEIPKESPRRLNHRQRFQEQTSILKVNKTRPPPSNRPYGNHGAVFLCHAELYVFGESRDIDALRTLAIRKLHSELSNFTLWPTRTKDIVPLIRYIYDNTPAHPEGTPEPLRELIMHFISFSFDTLSKDEDFPTIALTLDKETADDYLRDLMQTVNKRIAGPSADTLPDLGDGRSLLQDENRPSKKLKPNRAADQAYRPPHRRRNA